MTNYLRRLMRTVFLCILLSATVLVTGVTQGFSPAVQTRLQQIIDSFQNNPANPYIGGMCATIDVDGLALWQGATGYAARNIDNENNLMPGGTTYTCDLISPVYSVTKTFTAALVLELANEGYLNLDAQVSQFFPLNQINPSLNGAVTLRQLLAHESGYSDYVNEYMLQIAVGYQPTHVWNVFETISFVHQINPPGTKREYSNTNYVMLGAVIEMVTGKTIEQHFRERFFDKLSLTSMYLNIREQRNGHGVLTAPHDNISMLNPVFYITGQPMFPDAYTNISRFPLTAVASLAFTGGGIVSNSADLAKWSNALYGGRATSAATLNTMLHSMVDTADEDGDYLGYGIWTNHKVSNTDYFVGHNGSALGYRSIMMYQTDRKMTIAITCNYAGADLYEVARKLYEALPQFLCGNDNRKDAKILLCYKGKEICIAREAAPEHIKKGAYLGGCTITSSSAAVVTTSATVPMQFTVFPNPFNHQLTVSWQAADNGAVQVQLFDGNGKLVRTMFNGTLQKGMYKTVTVQTGNLLAGMYVCRIQSAAGMQQQKLILTK